MADTVFPDVLAELQLRELGKMMGRLARHWGLSKDTKSEKCALLGSLTGTEAQHNNRLSLTRPILSPEGG